MLLEPHAGTIVWTIITFLVVFFILRATVWKPLLAFLDERERRISEALENAEQARLQAQTLLREHQQKLEQAEEEAREIVRKSLQAAERVHQETVESARREAQQAVEQARLRIESEKRAAIAELRRETANLAVQAAGLLVGANLDDERNRRLVDEMIAGIAPPAGS
jgi:F-type H+-transporting ATPase subunit b